MNFRKNDGATIASAAGTENNRRVVRVPASQTYVSGGDDVACGVPIARHWIRRPRDASALRLRAFATLTGFTFASIPALAGASPVTVESPAEVDVPEVYNGVPVEECAWPTVVAVTGGGLCTGTLIHPELVVYAAHCGGGQKSLRFSTTSSTIFFSTSGLRTTPGAS